MSYMKSYCQRLEVPTARVPKSYICLHLSVGWETLHLTLFFNKAPADGLFLCTCITNKYTEGIGYNVHASYLFSVGPPPICS